MFNAVMIAVEGNAASWMSDLTGYGTQIVGYITEMAPIAIGVAVPILGVRKAISFFTGLIRSA